MNGVIYVLCDPETNEVRYVGWTTRPQTRLKVHCREIGNTHRHHWIASLRERRLKPVMEIVYTVKDTERWQDAECEWIAYYRGIGTKLTNGTDGGQGALGRPASEKCRETIRKIATGNQFAKGKRWTEERRTKMRGNQNGKGHKWSEQQRAAYVAKVTGKPSPMRGYKHTDESRKHMSDGCKGKRLGNQNARGHKVTPEAKARMKLAKKLKRMIGNIFQPPLF